MGKLADNMGALKTAHVIICACGIDFSCYGISVLVGYSKHQTSLLFLLYSTSTMCSVHVHTLAGIRMYTHGSRDIYICMYVHSCMCLLCTYAHMTVETYMHLCTYMLEVTVHTLCVYVMDS